MGFLGSGVWFSVNEVKDGGRERHHGGGIKVGVGLKVATSFSPVLIGGLTPPFGT